MRGRSWRNPQRVPTNDVKTLMFPWTHYVWHLRSVASFEVQAAVFQVRRGYSKQGAYLEGVSQPHASGPHTVAPASSLSCGFMQRAHMWMCTLGVMSTFWFDSQMLFSPPSLSFVFVAGPDRPLNSRMTTRTPGSSTMLTGNASSAFSSSSPQRRLAVLWTGRHKVTFLALCFSFPLLPTSTQHLLQSIFPDTRTIFW